MKYIDLFCGVGGFSQGLQKANHQCVLAADNDPEVMKSYKANFPSHNTITEDIRKLEKLPPHDILCAGFPCQSFSICGKRKADTQLALELLKIVDQYYPRYFIFENVPHFLKINGGEFYRHFINTLERTHITTTHILNSKDFGTAQNRKRIFITGHTNWTQTITHNKRGTYSKYVVEDILEPNPPESVHLTPSFNITIRNKYTTRNPNKILRIGEINGKKSQGYRLYSPKGLSATITANGGGLGAKTGLYFVNTKPRKLSLLECKRLFGFPDSFHVKNIRQIGNSVCPNIIQSLGEDLNK